MFQSPDVYPLLFILAICVIAILFGRREASLPAGYLVDCSLSPAADLLDLSSLKISVDAHGSLLLTRPCVMVSPEANVYLKVTVADSKITVEEQVNTPKNASEPAPVQVVASLDMIRPGRYSFRYDSRSQGIWAITHIECLQGFDKTLELKF